MACGIYKFENKINKMVYIGQAIDLQERYNKHLKNMNDLNHKEDFYIGLREFGINNFSFAILEEFEEFDKDLLNELECYYIEKFNSLKPNGYNMVPGGTNGAGLAKGKIVCQYDLQGNFIAEFPSAHQASLKVDIDNSSISACCRGEKKHTKNYQWKYKDSDKIINDISKEKLIIPNRKVYQYTLQKELINIYNSLNEAYLQTNIAKSAISKVCSGKGHTAGGYIWRYEDNQLQLEDKITSKTKKVIQYDKNGNYINEYNSITEAAELTGTNKGNLQSVCANKRKTANNYIWKYKE